jgi:hypothetical protein
VWWRERGRMMGDPEEVFIQEKKKELVVMGSW